MSNDLRRWLDIVLCEAERRVIAARHVGYPNEPFPVEVYIDPSKHDLLRIIRNDPFHSARLIRGLDGHVYASTANLTHVDLWTSLGFPLSDFGKVKDDRQLVQGNDLEFVYGKVGRDPHSQAAALRQWTQVVTEEAWAAGGAALSEARQRYYHGSRKEFPVGFILQPQSDGYVHGVAGDEFDAGIRRIEAWLEKFRPPKMISRLEAVFLAPSIDAIEHAGGNANNVYMVEPIGACERSCLWWYDSIENYLLDDESIPLDLGQRYAENYWRNKSPPAGKPATYEYRCRAARIVRIVGRR